MSLLGGLVMIGIPALIGVVIVYWLVRWLTS